jgi:hypothetical protein
MMNVERYRDTFAEIYLIIQLNNPHFTLTNRKERPLAME